MALKISVKDTEFGVGDRVRVVQRVKDGDKNRESIFDGMVMAIRGRGVQKTFLVRRIGEAGVGIERIFPVELPSISKITVVKHGTEGVKRAKLYYTRIKAPTEIEMIFKKASNKIKSGTKSTNK
jgi:large subunit ribosomal protein L19